jgi:hypothetical protein
MAVAARKLLRSTARYREASRCPAKMQGRPDDAAGIAGVVNGVSGVQGAFVNAGGLGILVGDG